MKKIFLIVTTLHLLLGVHAQERKTLIVFFDGLRPDYITPEAMPNLYAFKQQGAYGNAHHSVFPTVTRVNASSFATGSYPGTHGLLGNSVYFPEVNRSSSLSTGEAENLNKIESATNGKLLTVVSLGELMQSNSKRMMVFSSGSTGQAMLQNHTISGGAIINPALILPASFKDQVIREMGPVPGEDSPDTSKHRWITDALIRYGLAADGPEVNTIWFSDPDGAGHSNGIGSEAAMSSIKMVDEQFGRIISALTTKGQADSFNIFVSTDHGFVTHIGKVDLTEFLIKQGFKKDAQSEDIVVADGGIYVKNHDKTIIKKIIGALQQQEWVGGLFTKAKKTGDAKGWVDGTLSYEVIHWDHVRAADILVDVNWNDDKNSMGYAGSSFSQGVAGHGGCSPYEVHIPLIVSGPDFKKSFELEAPTSNVDIVPTVLYLHHIAVPASMDGRVLHELLAGSPQQNALSKKQETISTNVKMEWGTYELKIERTKLGKYSYIDQAKVIRTFTATKK